MTLTDAELADHLKITPKQASKLPADKRLAYENLIRVGNEIDLWLSGIGPKPDGVLVDTERSTRRRRAWK